MHWEEMYKKFSLLLITITVIIGFSTSCFAAKIAPPQEAGKGFKVTNLEDAKKMHEDGATVIACHSHTTDFMKGHPQGTLHITCMVPKDHKRVDLPLDQVAFDVNELPVDKNANIITYCASDT